MLYYISLKTMFNYTDLSKLLKTKSKLNINIKTYLKKNELYKEIPLF